MTSIQLKGLQVGDSVQLPSGALAQVVSIDLGTGIIKCRPITMHGICDSVTTYSYESLIKL